ncbi:hypothetical protein HanRHA438_Chr17g0797751 [Helianthus annuus]|nr:hypothetical protein HanRHA438_Chr17g0797751 [Helianthus annuus]
MYLWDPLFYKKTKQQPHPTPFSLSYPLLLPSHLSLHLHLSPSLHRHYHQPSPHTTARPPPFSNINTTSIVNLPTGVHISTTI